MLQPRFAKVMLAVGLTAFGGIACSQDYPTKPIRIITGGIGGSTDFAARLIAFGLTNNLRQQVVVENRGGGVIHGDLVAKSPPDGYTLLVHGSNIWLAPLLRDNVPYDPLRDLAAISLTNTSPNVLVVHPSLPVKSVKDLVALAKARPGALNYSSGSTGSSSHLMAELFNALGRVNLVRVVYKSDASETADLLSGQVQLTFGTPSVQIPHVKAGRLRALAVTSATPSVLLPGLPTIAATGLPGYEALSIVAMFAPAKTPPALINRLNQEVVRVLGQPDVKEKFLASGVETVGSSPEQLTSRLKSEITKWGKVIKDAGISEK